MGGEPDCLCPCGHINNDHSFDGQCFGIVGVKSQFGNLDYSPPQKLNAILCDCKDNNDNGRRTNIYPGQLVSHSWQGDFDGPNKGGFVKNEPQRCQKLYCNSGELTTKFISVSNDSNRNYFFVCKPCLIELAQKILKQVESKQL